MPIANNAMIAAITGRNNQRNDDQSLTFDNDVEVVLNDGLWERSNEKKLGNGWVHILKQRIKKRPICFRMINQLIKIQHQRNLNLPSALQPRLHLNIYHRRIVLEGDRTKNECFQLENFMLNSRRSASKSAF